MQISKIKSIKKLKINKVIYDVQTDSHTLNVNNIWVHNCSGNSPLYFLKNGLRNIPNIMSTSKPANSAQTFARHLCSMTQFLTSQFAGAIGWEGINIFFAPLCRNLSNKDLKQLAQTLIYDLSQLAGAKGGQTSFTDFNCYITVPKHYRDVYAMFEGGKFGCIKTSHNGELIKFFDERKDVDTFIKENDGYKILTYADYEEDAQRFLSSILDVIKEGDATGLPFAFPKINLHINEDTFTTDGKEENKPAIKLLNKACESSAKTGCPYFIFDRNAMSVSQCCFTSDTEIDVKYHVEDGYDLAGVCTFRELASAIGVTHKPEEDVDVYVYDRGEYRIGKFIRLKSEGHKIFKITTTDNLTIKCTENHMHLLYSGEIASTTNLLIGDLLCRSYNNTRVFTKISAIEEIEYNDKYVYCFEMHDSNNPYFTLANGVVTHNCRLSIQFTEEDKKLIKTPEELRFVGVQNVSINLPNCVLQSKGNEEKFFKELEARMRLAMKAHIQKVEYLEHLMSIPNSPLSFYNKGVDGKPYVNLKKGSYLIGLVGLNECVYNLIGKQLHEGKEAHIKGLHIITFMNKIVKQLSKEFDVNVKLEETPAESTAARFALIDKKNYSNAFVKQNDIGIYYSNSCHFAYDSDVDYIERLTKQSQYHPLIDAGAMIHLWCGDHLPSANALFELVKLTWYKTKCAQWVLSPEYTICHDCNKTHIGFFDKCPKCESDNLDMVSRITGYYIKVSSANKGKKAEIKDRNHDAYLIK